MNMRRSVVFAAAVAMAEVVLAKGLVEYPGVVDEKSGWRCVASEEGKTVYVPFEGYYESKGGRIESPKFELDKAPEDASWNENFVHARYEDWAKKVVHIQPMRRDFQRKVVAKRGVAYFDLTTATCDAILRSRKPLDWFKRDIAHNDDRGKQLIAQRLAAYFNILESRRAGDR